MRERCWAIITHWLRSGITCTTWKTGEQSTNSDVDEAGEILVAAENMSAQLESVKQMWYDAGFQGNFAEKSVRDAFADRSNSVLAQLAVMSLHTLQSHLQNTTAGSRFSEIAADMSARISTTERQERDNKEGGASSSAEVTQTDYCKRL